MCHEENPENIKWKDLSVDYVLDSSGKFTEKENAMVNILYRIQREKGINCYDSNLYTLLGAYFERKVRFVDKQKIQLQESTKGGKTQI